MTSLVTADSLAYTADSYCITADGYNGCSQSGGGSSGGAYIPKLDWDDVYRPAIERKRAKIKREDNEIIEIIKAIMAKGIL